MTRFGKLSASIQKKSNLSKAAADATAAKIGREKYGKTKFQKMAVAGKKKK
jgi:hypothetical protein